MKAYDKYDSWFNDLEKRYEKKFESINLIKSTMNLIVHKYRSDWDLSKHIYASIKIQLDDTRYEFTHNFNVEIDEEDFKIELDKLMRKWYKIINEIITRIECYEIEEKDFDKL